MPRTSKITALLPELYQNVTELYRRVTPEDVAAGGFWYQRAESQIRQWAEWSGKSPETVAAMVAALSPQCEWGQNLKAAEQLLMNGEITTHGPLQANILKAKRILAEDITDTRKVFVAGPKVYNFSLNLAGDHTGVTVDTHMVQAIHADPYWRGIPKPNIYNVYATAVTAAADDLAIAPAVLQAILWHTWKRLHPSGVKRAARTKHNAAHRQTSSKTAYNRRRQLAQ